MEELSLTKGEVKNSRPYAAILLAPHTFVSISQSSVANKQSTLCRCFEVLFILHLTNPYFDRRWEDITRSIIGQKK